MRLARGLLKVTALIRKAVSARSLMVLADDASWQKVASRMAPARWSETAKRECSGSIASRQLALPPASVCLPSMRRCGMRARARRRVLARLRG